MKDLNLFEGIKKAAPQKKTVTKTFLPGLILLAVCTVAVAGLYILGNNTQKELDAQIAALNTQIQSEGTPGQADTGANELSALQAYNQMLSSLDAGIEDYPKLDSALFKDIAGRMPADLTAQSITYENGLLTITCLSENVDSPAIFAGALRESAYVEYINCKRSSFYTPENSEAATDKTNAATNEKKATTDETATAAEEGTQKIQFVLECYLKGGVAE